MTPIRIKTFMDRDFKQFSVYDNVRSLPGPDGFKPSQRKVIHALIKRGENAGEIKVAQLGAYTAMVTDYHHGEASLFSTIIGLAQDYCGANNLNLLNPNGSFGGRLSNEPSAARYIFTELSPHFRKIFKKEDDSILKKQFSDGDEIEPELYFPIIPILLVNGSKGMGTGYANSVLQYHPHDVRDYCIAKLNGKKAKPLVPWYRGFRGKIFRNVENEANPNQVVFEGALEIVNTTTIQITEIPPGTELSDYKKVLNRLKEDNFIQDYDDHCDNENDLFSFEVKVPRTTTQMSIEDLLIKFKLISRDSENVTLWDHNGHIREFKDIHGYADYFIEWRTGNYEVRRLKLIDVHTETIRYMSEKLKFILYYLKNTKEFHNKKKAELMAMLEAQKFTDINKLMSLPIWSLTHDEVEKLKNEIGDTQLKIDTLKQDTAQAMYLRELKELKFDL